METYSLRPVSLAAEHRRAEIKSNWRYHRTAQEPVRLTNGRFRIFRTRENADDLPRWMIVTRVSVSLCAARRSRMFRYLALNSVAVQDWV